MDDDVEAPRKCTWTACADAAAPGSVYCARHADLLTEDRMRAMLARRLAPTTAHKAAAAAARRTAQQRSDARRGRRRAASQSRQRQRISKPKKDHGRKKS